MSASWELWHHTPDGRRHSSPWDFALSFEITRVVNGIGWWRVVLPGDFDDSTLRVDGIQEFWRSPTVDKPMKRVVSGFLRKIGYGTDENGNDYIIVGGPDINDIVRRRIIAYAAGSSQSSKTDQAGDIILAIGRENFGASASASRDLSANGLTVMPDANLGVSITRGFSWRQVERVFGDIADASSQDGTEIFWDIVHTDEALFNLRVYSGQPGQDRTVATGTKPVVFSKERDNLQNPFLELDYSEEITYVYAGGQGEETDREIVEVEDTDRSGRSIWGRIEAFVDARNEPVTAGVTAAAKERLWEGRPRLRFTGDLISAPGTVFGLNWDHGDRVTVEYRGYQLSGLVRSTHIIMNEEGIENIKSGFEVNDVI